MDDKKQAKKNRLDLEYHGEAQKRNATLILLTTGTLGFIGTFIWLKEKNFLYLGVLIASVIIFFGVQNYRKITKRMKNILTEIENL